MSYMAPEFFTKQTYDAKSDIWSLGCLMYQLCTQKAAFSAESIVILTPMILHGPYPSLPEQFSPELHQLLNDIFSRDPESRPTASDILQHPFILSCLSKKSKTTVEDLQHKLTKLRTVADDLERVHEGTTIGSLAGNVIGAVGGITSIVGIILAPFTLGASLIVSGVGMGMSTVGGVAAGASNITNMVNQSSDRKAVRSIIKEFEEKINAVVTWLQAICNSLQAIKNTFQSADIPDNMDSSFSDEKLARLGLRAGKALDAIPKLIRLVQAISTGKIAAQATKAVRVADKLTGVFSALFIAIDLFFIAMEAKEIHHIRQSSSKTTQARSDLMKFVKSVREAADNLQGVLDELRSMISSIPSFGDDNELE
uniref:apolipoprotein L3-like n=1 Tax=Monopterus albus TaxID=43700 RepID=UPI0009B3F536|nr:apolipoprotein L3-like [Monopterus albus]